MCKYIILNIYVKSFMANCKYIFIRALRYFIYIPYNLTPYKGDQCFILKQFQHVMCLRKQNRDDFYPLKRPLSLRQGPFGMTLTIIFISFSFLFYVWTVFQQSLPEPQQVLRLAP